MVTAVSSDDDHAEMVELINKPAVDRRNEHERTIAGIHAWHDAVRAYGKNSANIARGRAARKLDHALSALICLTPEERLGFLFAATRQVQELDAKGIGPVSDCGA